MDNCIIVFALILSAFCSSMEVAFVSSNRLKIELHKKNSPFFAFVMNVLMKKPEQFLITMIVGNCCALIVYTILISNLVSGCIVDNIAVEVILAAVVFMIMAQSIPKAVAKAMPNWYLKTFIVPLYILFVILYPISKILSVVALGILKLGNNNTQDYTAKDRFNTGDLQNFVDQTVAEIPNNELPEDPLDFNFELLQNALEFPELKVRDCMVPRVEVEAYDVNDSIDGLKKLFIGSQYTRVPLYEGELDKIVGYANSRDIFKAPQTVLEICSEVIYTSESALVKDLLLRLIKEHKSLAIVIDEYGGAAGIITIEDILEQIVGEIEDEHDQESNIEKQINNSEWIFSGRLEVDYLNEKYGLEIPESEMYETLAGYILFTMQELPIVGQQFVIDNFEGEIIKASSNRVTLVRLRKTEN